MLTFKNLGLLLVDRPPLEAAERRWRPLPISRLVLDPHTALPRAHRRSSVVAGTQLKRGANSWAAGIARLRRPYGPASDHLGPCRLPTGRHFASPGQVQNSQTDDTNPGGDQESMEWEEIDDDTSLLVQLQNWSIAEDLSMEYDTTENTENATATGSSY
ncbi:hypothetical protein J6590_103820 [Homalodisca vitripennis]|nr:hypothetical protein J6590_103820 [Homalodisca vitripennis]